ncbi:c-type cytochrome [Hydrogenimonas sp.]
MKKIAFASILLLSTVWASEGEDIFNKICYVCHGKQAQKSSLGVSRVIAGWKAERIVEKLKEYKSGQLDQYGFGSMMRNRATKLTDQQMQAVAKYIESLGTPKK